MFTTLLVQSGRRVVRQARGLCISCQAQRQYSVDTPSRQTLASSSTLVRPIGTPDAIGLEDDLTLYPDFFTLGETRDLLSGALYKLDRVDPTRKRRRKGVAPDVQTSLAPLQDLFTGPYGFQEGHYDSVIHDYRESTTTYLPPPALFPNVSSLLDKAYALLPGSPQIQGENLPPETITHLLHLAPSGKILGHVDNLDASGSVIMGICLGSDRILRLSKIRADGTGIVGWDVLLRNGTVYLQKDRMRYEYEHAILGYDESEWDGEKLGAGHRLSIMIRDAPKRSP